MECKGLFSSPRCTPNYVKKKKKQRKKRNETMRAPIKAYSWQKYWILKAHRLARWWLAAPVPGRGLHPDRTRRISSEDWNGGWQLLCWADVSPSLTGDLKEFQRFGFFVLFASQLPCCILFIHTKSSLAFCCSTRLENLVIIIIKIIIIKKKRKPKGGGRSADPSPHTVRVQALGSGLRPSAPPPSSSPTAAFPSSSSSSSSLAPSCLSRRRWRGG